MSSTLPPYAIARTLQMSVPSSCFLLEETAKPRRGRLSGSGALLYGEYVAGAVVAVMLATGAALESWAAGRAERDLARLLERAPRVAHRVDGDRVTTIPAEQVRPGDRHLRVVVGGDRRDLGLFSSRRDGARDPRERLERGRHAAFEATLDVDRTGARHDVAHPVREDRVREQRRR